MGMRPIIATIESVASRLAGEPDKQRVWLVSNDEPLASAFVTEVFPATQHVTPDHAVEGW